MVKTRAKQSLPPQKRSAAVHAPLSKELREKYGIRSVRVRVGDTVKVMRGSPKGVVGKITKVFVKSGKVAIEGVHRERVRGGQVPIKIHSSKVQVTSLNLDDKWRREKLEKLSQKVAGE